MSNHVTDLPDEQIAPPFQLLDLPEDVLSIVVSAGLTSPRDVASVSATCKRLHSISKRAPFRLHLNELLHSAATFSSSTTTQEDAQAQLHEILAALCHSFPGTAELNLASLPLGNEGVVLVQKNLLNLAFLKLSGCKKLTSDAVIAVIKPTSTATATSAVSGSTSTLRCVDFQRCYQLTAEDLTTLLNACTRPGSKLSCAALSHLDLSSWTLKTFSKFSSSPSTLRMLALHNGIKLTAPGLRSIVSACPLLEVLCLGGSVLNLDQNSQVTPSITPTLTTATAATLIEDAVTNSGGSSPTAATAEQNNYSNSLQSTSPSSPSRSMFHTLSLLDRHEDDDGNLKTIHGEVIYRQQDPLVSQLLKNAGSCGLSPILLSSSHGIWLKNSAAELAAAAYRLPNLCILELTHCAPGLTLLVRKILESNSSPSTIASTVASTTTSASTATTAVDRVHVWDMCSAESVSAALHWRSTCTTRSTISTTTTTTTTTTTAEQTVATTLPRSDIEMIVTAMARCSSPGRITALHSAAEDGDVSLLSNLLSLGAEVDARDRGGASSLFCACEAGHAGAVATLLGAGASATLRNAAGEAPLYIAALRGHEQVVEVLLNYCAEKEITWQDQRLYGDGWTPLHAAAVSGRLGIAAILLAAAGPIDAAALVAASNRYGQTCVHVAARKGTPALVQLLIEAGGSASLAVADCDGRTAADVARRNGNAGAWKLLTGTMSSARSRTHQLQRATTPTVEKKARQQLTAAQHTGSNRWVGRRLGQRRVENV